MGIRLKRVYDQISKSDGYRILVDRLWPRGLKKSEARINEWLKEIAPSTGLRKSFGHDVARWPDFKKRYWAELDEQQDQVEKLVREARKRPVTLLYAAKDIQHNNAAALKEYIERKMK